MYSGFWAPGLLRSSAQNMYSYKKNVNEHSAIDELWFSILHNPEFLTVNITRDAQHKILKSMLMKVQYRAFDLTLT